MKSIRKVFQAAGLSIALMAGGAASAETLEVAANIGNVPWEYQDESGKLAGFEIDLVNEISKRLGYEPNYTAIPFNGLFAAVKSGRAQMAISSITIKPARMENVDFAQPYYDSDQALAVGTDSGVKNLADLKGKAVAVETGSTGDSWASENQAKYGFSEVRRYEGISNALLDVGAGRVAGYIFDIPNVQFYIKDKPNYAIVERIVTNEQFGMIFQKGDGELRKKVNNVISDLKKEGFIAGIHEKYFGVKPEASTSTVKILPMPAL